MNVVVDANLLVAWATDSKRGPAVRRKLDEWYQHGDVLQAPALLRYEVANGLTRIVAGGAMTAEEAARAWRRIGRVPITFHRLDDVPSVVAIALKLRRQSAYDAAYIALAQEMHTNVWTLDGPLARNAEQTDLPVKLLPAD